MRRSTTCGTSGEVSGPDGLRAPGAGLVGQQAILRQEGRWVHRSGQGEPGTVLHDGLVVQEGTVLVGTPIPRGVGHFYRGEPVVDLGWWALLFVHGSPEEVMEQYLRHAEDHLGLERDDIPAGAPEDLREDLPADQQRYTNCGVAAEGSRGWRCVGAAFSDGGAPCVHYELVRRKAHGTVESFLLVRYIVNPNGCVPGSTPLIGHPTRSPLRFPPTGPSSPRPVRCSTTRGAAWPACGSRTTARWQPSVSPARTAASQRC